MPGWIALTRIGASSVASTLIIPSTPPFTVDTVTEPGYGRSLARPPNTTIEPSRDSRPSNACTTSRYPTSLSVTRCSEAATSYPATVFSSRAISRPRPEVPPTTTTQPVSAMALLPQVLPVAHEPVRVAAGWLRCLGLQPAQRTGTGVAERVHATDPGERDVTRAQPVPLAVEGALPLALEEQVRLLERVVVRAGHPAQVVADHGP